MGKIKVGAGLTQATSLLQAAGLTSARAATSARCIVASDRWGIGSHGLMRLPFYLERLQAGGINPNADLKLITDTKFSTLLNMSSTERGNNINFVNCPS